MRIVKPTLLLTGAAGVLGRALIDELSPDFTIVALRHRTRLADPRVREFAGSLNDPTLGLSERDYAHLADSVDVVAAQFFERQSVSGHRDYLCKRVAAVKAVLAGCRFQCKDAHAAPT